MTASPAKLAPHVLGRWLPPRQAAQANDTAYPRLSRRSHTTLM